MNATESTAGRTLADYIQHMRDCVQLSQYGDDHAAPIPGYLIDRLDLAHHTNLDYPGETAWAIADSSIYGVERLATVADDGTVGDLREVELLLGGGGPTITFTVKLRDGEVRGADLWHSWGAGVGHEATVSIENQADLDTTAEFLSLLGVTDA